MKTVKSIFLILIIGIMIIPKAENGMGEKLSLQDFLTLAASNDIRFQRILYDRLYLDYNEILDLPVDEFILSLQSQYDIRFGDQDGITSTVSLSRLFSETNTFLKTEYSTRSYASTSNSTALEVYVSQPVLRNAFGRLNEIKRRNVEINAEIVGLYIAEAYEDYLASLIIAFYEWYEIHENLKIARVSYRENEKLLESMEKRRKANIALPIDVNKVKIQLLGKKQSLMELEAAYEEAYRIVTETIGEASGVELVPEIVSGIAILPGDLGSRTQELYGLLSERSRNNEDLLKEELRPDLRLNLGVAIEGDKIWIENNKNSIFTSVSFGLPFFNTKAKARVEVAELQSIETQLEGEDIISKLKLDARNLESAIQWKEKMISIVEERIELAKSIMQAESENYTLGKADLNDYISAVNTYDSQRYSRLAQHMALLRLELEYARLTDGLLTDLPNR